MTPYINEEGLIRRGLMTPRAALEQLEGAVHVVYRFEDAWDFARAFDASVPAHHFVRGREVLEMDSIEGIGVCATELAESICRRLHVRVCGYGERHIRHRDACAAIYRELVKLGSFCADEVQFKGPLREEDEAAGSAGVPS